ncbi:hypothetical protein MKK88_14300 [Methylobacterium sp. E-005]|uniref:hypothetical protein n=1 Tax=Methylobacterium sp. E-005 TaxID=2836549 RepID=UPI001FBB9D34|nr:hypothetical protein [Methylobacterium sp. E-005]MCJ2087147.1 hypothetical protein [Methylobacterium sp. E-005]
MMLIAAVPHRSLNDIDHDDVQPMTDRTDLSGGMSMSTKTLGLAAALTLAITGAALAQMPAGSGSGSAQSNMSNPGSVKSPSEKRMGGQRGMMSMRHMKRNRRHHMRRSRM